MPLLNIDKQKHLLAIFIKEPIEGKVKPSMAKDSSSKDAWIRYQAIVLTLVKQLEGITETDIVFLTEGEEASQAVQFWILSQLPGKLEAIDSKSFKYSAKEQTNHHTISFKDQLRHNIDTIRNEGKAIGYTTISVMGANCPACGTRWIQMAQLLATSKSAQVLGLCQNNSIYLSTVAKDTESEYKLPILPKIKTTTDWDNALNSALGGKLRTAYKSITGIDL